LGLRNKVSVKGFRPGKFPQSLLEKRFKKVMREEAIETLVPEYFEKALKQEKLKPATRPTFDNLEIEKKKPLVFTASFDVFADFDIPEYSAYSLEKIDVEYTDEEIQEQKQRHLDGAATYSPKEGKAEEGDQVTIDFEGKLEDKTIAESKDHKYSLGSNNFLPEFETALAGMSKDEEKEFDLTFPPDYSEESLREKTATFQVKVTAVEKKTQPELNEKFFGIYGGKIKSEEEFNKMVEDEVKFRKEGEIQNKYRSKLKEQLNTFLTFDLPEKLLREETEIQLNQAKRKKEQAKEEFSVEELEKAARENAGKQLRFSIFVQKMLDENEEIKTDEMDVNRRFEMNCAMMGINPQELMGQDYGRQIYQEIYGMVTEETVLDYITKKVLGS